RDRTTEHRLLLLGDRADSPGGMNRNRVRHGITRRSAPSSRRRSAPHRGLPLRLRGPTSQQEPLGMREEPPMLPANYRIHLVEPPHYEAIIEICKLVYPTETPYTAEELEDHRQVFPQGQFVAVDGTRNAVAGVHFTLRLRMADFHIDD